MAGLPRQIIDLRSDTYTGRAALALPGGRLAVNGGTVVSPTDVVNDNIYYGAFNGRMIPIYDGTSFVNRDFVAFNDDVSALILETDTDAGHTLYHQTGKNFDVFMFMDTSGDVLTMRLGTAAAWASDTARAATGSGFDATSGEVSFGGGVSGPEGAGGIYTNTEEVQLRYGTGATDLYTVEIYSATWLGTMRVISGDITDSARQRHLFNAYNRVPRRLMVKETTNTWNYSSATIRQVRASTDNQIEVVRGLDDDPVFARTSVIVTNDDGTARNVYSGIGLDSTTVKAADCLTRQATCTNANIGGPSAEYVGHPGLGFHYLAWLEGGGGAGTQTWYGDNGGSDTQSGMAGHCYA